MVNLRLASTDNKEGFARSGGRTPRRAKQTGEILQEQMMREHDEKRQEEIKVAGSPRAGGRKGQPVRSQDTRTGQTGIWVPDEARLQGHRRGTVGQEPTL